MDQNTLVFALRPPDDYLHVGTAKDVLAHYDPVRVADTGASGLGQLEFYDADGAPLVIDRTGAAPVLAHAPVGTVADRPELLADRIALALALAQVKFDRHPNPALSAVRVPHLSGPLPVVVAAVSAWVGPLPVFGPNPPTPGGPVHTALHAVGLAHLFG